MVSGHSENTSQKESVPVNTLDELIEERRVDFIKMDVQGWEGEVFHGMRNVLEKNPGVVVYFEFWPYGLRVAGCNPEDLLQDISQFGFQLFEHVKGAQHRVSNFTELIGRLPGKKFTNLLAQR